MSEGDVLQRMVAEFCGDISSLSYLIGGSESPIERVLAWALHLTGFLEGRKLDCHNGRSPQWCEAELKDEHDDRFNTLLVVSQAPIQNYRCDFLVMSWPFLDGPPLRLVVECDGHDFHEKTKEQAARDKSRDRDLVSAGFQVMRFTGSEIWRDPMRCARDVYCAVDRFELRASAELIAASDRRRTMPPMDI